MSTSTTKSDATTKSVVLRRLADGDTIADLRYTSGMPSVATIAKWEREDPDFKAGLKLARAARAHLMVEDAMYIAEHAGEVEDRIAELDDDGNLRHASKVRVDATKLAQDRERISLRKWLASKWLPDLYGERSTHEHVGEGGGAMRLLIGPTAEAYEAVKARQLTQDDQP